MDMIPVERRADERESPPATKVVRSNARERLRRIVSTCDSAPEVPWFRMGTPAPLLALALWLTPFMLAGIVRYVTGAALGIGLTVALPLLSLLGGLLWLRPKSRGRRADPAADRLALLSGVIGMGIVAWAYLHLYSFDMGALSIYWGSDGGTHIAQRRTFVESDPKIYAGFVTVYAATHLVDRLFSLTPPTSLALAFYSTVAAVAVVPVIAMTALLQSHRVTRRAQLMGLAAFTVAWSWSLRNFALPVVSNMQVDGFYAHFFGLLPCALVWVADILVLPRLLRIFCVGLAVLLCRFTYGLNLGDLLLTCGGLWLLDSAGARRRVLPIVVAAVAIGAGILAYANLTPIFRNGGYVEVYGWRELPRIMAAAALALGGYAIIDHTVNVRSKRRPYGDGPLDLLRTVRMPLFLAVISLVANQYFASLPGIDTYYRLKYPLMPLVFLVAAVSISIGYTALIVMKWVRPVVALTAFVASFVFGAVSLAANDALGVWQRELADRTGPKPHEKLRPLVDPEIWRTIQATLHNEGKTFGGLVSADLPAANFLQAWIGFANTSQGFFQPDRSVGHCVFWTSVHDDPSFLWIPERPALEATRASLQADPLKTCKSYDAAWATGPHTLCHRCY